MITAKSFEVSWSPLFKPETEQVSQNKHDWAVGFSGKSKKYNFPQTNETEKFFRKLIQISWSF